MVTNFGGSSSRGSSVSSLDSGFASRDSDSELLLLDFLLRAKVGSSRADV